jgi:polyhydroxybutyrate depolymerase
MNTGGIATGGIATGGIATGGVATGGVATGGIPGGGVATGGVSNSGVEAGGIAQTGGTNSGGTAAGGAADTTQCVPHGSLGPGETTQSLMVGGAVRTFVRYVPNGYTGDSPAPVVIDFHPLGGSGASWKGSTGWAELADREGIILIWPDGIANSWNAGRCCRTALEQNVDDVGFTRAIIESLQNEACIDAKRVYATGCSNGGGMAFRVACDAADVVAAVAPVDFDCVRNADANEPSCGQCSPARPITEIQFRGTSDSAVPYDGGMRQGGTTTFPGAQQNFAAWGQLNACTGSPEPLPGHPSCEKYPTCGAGTTTALCTVEGGMHCGSYGSFDIAEVAWEILKMSALP